MCNFDVNVASTIQNYFQYKLFLRRYDGLFCHMISSRDAFNKYAEERA